MDKIFLLSLLLIVIIITTSCRTERFKEHITRNDSDEIRLGKAENIEITDTKKDSDKTNEKYYDYKYTYNAGPSIDKIRNVTKEVISEKDERPININISYPPPPPSQNELNDRVVYYDTTLLQNLSGNPVDQVQTDYSVIEDDSMYKSWDKYYLPGYSYFPPSKWQLPRDNALIVPKELRDEKCDVCPLVATNSNDNYLSGDILKGNTVTSIPENKSLVTKYATVNKGMNGIGGKGTSIASQKNESS
tara:strand:+ start:3827 stop:4567 length:741 start_codon:yes stop_codon:yes gene_type:complete